MTQKRFILIYLFLYGKIIFKQNLITRMRQFKISEKYTARNENLNRYMEEVSKIEMLSPDEEFKIATRVRQGDKEAISHLVRANLRFVISVAKGYSSGDVSKLSDLINEGNIGLVEAAESFDPTTGFKFISYAVWHIRKNMMKYMTDSSRTIRIPQNKSTALHQMKEIESRLSNELERQPTPEEIVEVFVNTSPSMKDVKDLENSSSNLIDLFSGITAKPLSLEGNPDDPETEYGPINYLDGDLDGTDSLINNWSTNELLSLLLSQLTSREREVILCRFGIGKAVPESRQSIAARMEVSSETIRHWEIKIINKLSRISNRSQLKEEILEEL